MNGMDTSWGMGCLRGSAVAVLYCASWPFFSAPAWAQDCASEMEEFPNTVSDAPCMLETLLRADRETQRFCLDFFGHIANTREGREFIVSHSADILHGLFDAELRSDFYSTLHSAYLGIGRNEEAQLVSLAWTSEFPDPATPQGFRARYAQIYPYFSSYEEGSKQKIINLLEPLLEVAEALEPSDRQLIGSQLTTMYVATGRYDDAIRLAEATIPLVDKTDSRYLYLLQHLTESYLETRDYARALQTAEELHRATLSMYPPASEDLIAGEALAEADYLLNRVRSVWPGSQNHGRDVVRPALNFAPAAEEAADEALAPEAVLRGNGQPYPSIDEHAISEDEIQRCTNLDWNLSLRYLPLVVATLLLAGFFLWRRVH
jgi:hypothetical protein